MIEIEKAFAELPPPESDPRDAEAARRLWLRFRLAAIVEDDPRSRRLDRLRFASSALLMAALDTVVVLVIATALNA
jgi:hypothetical protein